ncbi:hypothetical protein BDW22DRAFT_335953 [Trametopsis cervina]|nr:hypothetical protein BDW22DRAFT_335953 [Trametopsis cervina]
MDPEYYIQKHNAGENDRYLLPDASYANPSRICNIPGDVVYPGEVIRIAFDYADRSQGYGLHIQEVFSGCDSGRARELMSNPDDVFPFGSDAIVLRLTVSRSCDASHGSSYLWSHEWPTYDITYEQRVRVRTAKGALTRADLAAYVCNAYYKLFGVSTTPQKTIYASSSNVLRRRYVDMRPMCLRHPMPSLTDAPGYPTCSSSRCGGVVRKHTRAKLKSNGLVGERFAFQRHDTPARSIFCQSLNDPHATRTSICQ